MPNDFPDWTSAVSQPTSHVAGFPKSVTRNGLLQQLGPVTIPTGVHGIGFVFGAPLNVTAFSVPGTTSGIDYAGLPVGQSITGVMTVKVYSGGADTAIQINVTPDSAGGTFNVDAVWIRDTLIQVVDREEPAGVILRAGGGNLISTEVLAGSTSVDVSLVQSTQPPWFKPKSSASVAVRALAAAASAVIVPAVIGKQVYVHDIFIEVDEAAGGPAFEVFQLRASVTTTQVFLRGDGAGAPKQWRHDAGGAATALSEGLSLLNNDNAAHNFSVTVGHTQQ